MVQKISKEQKLSPAFPIRTMWGSELVKSEESLRGSLAVVVDVLAATTNMDAFLEAYPHALYLVNDDNIRQALSLFPEAIVIGDIKHLQLNNVATFSNVPSDLAERNAYQAISGKTVLYRTNNGTAICEAALARHAHPVIGTSFTNLDAVCAYIQSQQPNQVTIIRAGEKTFGTDWKTGEDEICATILEQLLKGQSVSRTSVYNRVAASVRKQYPKDYQASGRTLKQLEQDIELVLQFNSRNVVPVCNLQPNSLIQVTRA